MSETDRRERLDAYLDGELEGEERRAFESELEKDADLREELERMRRTSGELRSFFDAEVATAVDDEGEAIAVERIVRMSTTQLKRRDIEKKRPRRSFLLIAALGLALVGFGILFASPWISGEPDAVELIEGARQEVESGFLRFEMRMATEQANGPDVDRGLWRLVWTDEFNAAYERGPGGLAHLRVGFGDLDAHFGRDDEGPWARLYEGEKIIRLGTELTPRQEQFFRIIDRLDSGLRAVIDEALEHPDSVELVGRVRDEEQHEYWKVQLGGALVDRRASFWFDEEERLARIKFGLYDLHLDRGAKLGPESFDPEVILPGYPIEDERE